MRFLNGHVPGAPGRTHVAEASTSTGMIQNHIDIGIDLLILPFPALQVPSFPVTHSAALAEVNGSCSHQVSAVWNLNSTSA